MGTKLTTVGEITTNFLLNDFTMYIMNTSATGGYVSTDWAVLGYTDPEKNITRNNEKYTKEAKIPRVPVWRKTIRKGMEITTALSNFDPEITSVIAQGTVVDLGSTGTRVQYGTDEPTTEYRAVMFSGDLENGTHYNLVIPKAEIAQDGDQTIGGEEEARFPLRVIATYNPSATASKNIYYEDYIAAGVNATALTPIGFS